MAAEPLLQDSDYNSASDEEFDPTAAAADDDDALSSSSEDAASAARSHKNKSKRKRADPEDDLDSGDEVTIAAAAAAAASRRGNKKQRASGDDDDEEEEEDGIAFLSDDDERGGEGGLVKTRAQRRAERKERRPLARVDGATADVDRIWAALSAAPVGKVAMDEKAEGVRDGDDAGGDAGRGRAPEAEEAPELEMVTIKRTYDFAGDRITEERQVPKDSAEARLYLAQQREKLEKQAAAGKKAAEAAEPAAEEEKEKVDGEQQQEQKGGSDKPSIRRPLRRPSRFDPNPMAEVKGLPPEKQLTWARRRALLDPSATPLPAATSAAVAAADAQAANMQRKRKEKADKLNTVDKSRLDWAGYVDKEGIADELDEYGRAKEGYLGRMDFLDRVEQRREEERRAAKRALET